MRTLVVASLLVCRVAVIVLCSTSLASMLTAPGANYYTAFKILEVALSVQLPWSAARLIYDAAVTLYHFPLPGRRTSWAIVAGESVLSCLTYAAGACALSVQVFFERDARECAFMAAGACAGYKASALLALSASMFTSAIAVLLFYLQGSRHRRAWD